MARRSPTGRFPALRQGRRRESLWFPLSWIMTDMLVNTAVVFSSLTAAALAFRPFTIVRTRGYLHIQSDQAGSSENQAIHYGEIVVTEEALAIGITAIPTPETEAASDWHVFETLATSFVLSSAVGFQADAGVGKAFDSKAMRKVDFGETLVTVGEVGVTGVSEGLEFRHMSRVLVKLH